MSEWVEEKDWSKVKPGQRVRLEHENGDLAEVTTDEVTSLWVCTPTNFFAKTDSWTLYVTPPPTPELPTEPGIYVTTGEKEWEKTALFLTPTAGWEFADGFPAKQTAELWHREAGLIRLAPEADTARKVLDLFLSSWKGQASTVCKVLTEVAAEFGVTEP